MGASCHVPAFEQSTQHLLRKIISQCQDSSILYSYYTCTVCLYVCMYVCIHIQREREVFIIGFCVSIA